MYIDGNLVDYIPDNLNFLKKGQIIVNEQRS